MWRACRDVARCTVIFEITNMREHSSSASNLLFFFVIICLTAVPSFDVKAGDAAKAPNGWGDLKFGMTASEVMTALGPRARINQPEPPRPLMLSDRKTPDIRAAVRMSQTIATAADVDDNSPKVVAARAIIKLFKPRNWKGRQAPKNPPPWDKEEDRPIQSIVGTLVEFSTDTHVHDFVTVFPKNPRMQTVSLLRDSLDPKSSEYAQEAKIAIFDLTEALLAEAREARQAGAAKQGYIKINPIEVREVTLMPEVEFTDGKLSKIRLGTPGCNDPSTPYNPGWPGMYRSICEALEEKYGPPDEKGRGDIGPFSSWRFPGAAVSCRLHGLGISVQYERLGADEAGNANPL